MPYTSLIRRLGTNAYAAAPTASTVEAAIRSMTAPTGRSAIDEGIWRSRSTVAWVAAQCRQASGGGVSRRIRDGVGGQFCPFEELPLRLF
jgi:hypothetical protein